MSSSDSISAVIVDDDEMIREAICLLLQRIDVKVLGASGNGRDAIAVIDNLKPKLAIMDICMPVLNGIDAAVQIHQRHPSMGILMLTGYPSWDYVIRSLKAGARGFVFKGGRAEELEVAVAAVAKGGVFVSPAVPSEWLSDINGPSQAGPELEILTVRQREVLQLIAEGASNKDVARILNLALRTVEKHRYELMKRLGVHTTAEVVLFAVRTGLVHPSSAANSYRKAS